MRTYEDYRVKGRPFPSKFESSCTIDKRHPIKRKEEVAFVELKENPLITVEGVACASCVSVMDR